MTAPRHAFRDLTETEYVTIMRDALIIRQRIIDAGEMATKTRVETELMAKHDLTRSLAHDVMNIIEQRALA